MEGGEERDWERFREKGNQRKAGGRHGKRKKNKRARARKQGLKGPKREKEKKRGGGWGERTEGGSHEQGGGKLGGKERGRGRGTKRVGAGSAAAAAAAAAAASAAPAARRLAHSLAVPAARRPALGCPLLRLLVRRSGAAQAPEDRTATGRLSPGRAAKQVGGWAGTARMRSLGALWAQGDGVWGF